VTDLLRISIPLTAWLVAFSAVYGLHGLVCSERWAGAGLDIATGRAAMTAVWALAAMFQLVLLVTLRSPRFASRSAFVRGVSLTLAITALVATLWTLIPIVTTSACL
jgi:hypothetical protein